MTRVSIFLWAAILTLATPARAQENVETVHWAFSTLFGTGWYQVDNNRSVFILRMPPRWTLSRSSFDPSEGRKLGIELHFPVTAGLHKFDELPDLIDGQNFGTISFTPGVEVEVPVTEAWYLRPFLKAGYGKEFETSNDAWIWNAGIKSRYRVSAKNADWDFLTNLYWAGYDDREGGSDDIAGFLLGFEAQHPFHGTSYAARWHLSYTRLSKALDFIDSDTTQGSKSIDDYITFGLAFRPPEGRYNFWWYRPTQLGLAMEVSPEGDYVGIKFNSRSWFTQ